MGWLQDARAVWRTLVIIATPIVLLPLVLPGSSQVSRLREEVVDRLAVAGWLGWKDGR